MFAWLPKVFIDLCHIISPLRTWRVIVQLIGGEVGTHNWL